MSQASVALELRTAALVQGAGPKRVVILGGGFAGVYTARELTRLLGRREDVRVELLSDQNYFVFQPLLPEVAAGGIAATAAVNPIRELVRGAQFRNCQVQSIDFADKAVLVTQGEGLSIVRVPYDHLVFCVGKVSNFSSMPGVAEHGMAMKTLSDAFVLRNHVINCLELADIEHDPGTRQALLTFLVAGGGFSGVETIGELEELVRRSLKYFKNIPERDVLFKLVHSQDAILPEMSLPLREAAQKILRKRGIELILKDRVRAASRDRVYLASGRVVFTRTFVCTVGNAPNPVAQAALLHGGFAEAVMNGRPIGAFATNATLECVGRPGYWAVGDCAGVPHPSGEGLCPPTAQFAIRQANRCAANIVAAIDGKPMSGFQFKALGALASLGARGAVADLMGVKLTGFVAWLAWRAIYLMKLPGWFRRVRVALDWFLDLFFPRDLTQLEAGSKDNLRVNHYEPGEMIVTEGQVGRELFVIKSGEVEVFLKAQGSEPERILRRLGPGEVFGEKALLEDSPRTASVRSVEVPVDVLVMSRADFRSLVGNFKVLRDHFAQILKANYPAELEMSAMADVMKSQTKKR